MYYINTNIEGLAKIAAKKWFRNVEECLPGEIGKERKEKKEKKIGHTVLFGEEEWNEAGRHPGEMGSRKIDLFTRNKSVFFFFCKASD